MHDIYLARQPIFDGSQAVVGYELLHRSGPDNFFRPIDADVASSSTVDQASMSLGLEDLTEGRLAFVNVSRRVLLDEIYTLLPAKTTVLELLETVAPEPSVVEACYRLKCYGYRLALDDFAGDPSLVELLSLADIIKVDVQHPDAGRAFEMVAHLHKRGVQLLAEKVETAEMMRQARSAGYDYFQGYFFCRPQMLHGKDLSPSKLSAMRFLSEVCREDASFERLEEVFKEDVSLSARLLRYLNSAGFGWTHEITSLEHALRLVGMRQLQKWGAMMGVVALSADRPQELAAVALARARFAEQLGRNLGEDGRELEYFLTGLLSLMDAMMDRPLSEVLARMTVAEPVRKALLEGGTSLSAALECVVAYERGDWGAVDHFVSSRELERRPVHDAYTSSLRWAREAMSTD